MEKPSLEITQEYAIPGVWKTVLLGPRQRWSCSGARHVGGRGKQQFSSAVDALPNWAVHGGEWKALRLGLFILGGKNSHHPLICGWVVPRSDLDFFDWKNNWLPMSEIDPGPSLPSSTRAPAPFSSHSSLFVDV